MSSVLAYAEGRAAIAAAARGDRIRGRALAAARADLGRLCAEVATAEVDLALAVAAGELAERYSLRGYDAVHLATALALGPAGLVVATWDRTLGRAARDAGLATFPV